MKKGKVFYFACYVFLNTIIFISCNTSPSGDSNTTFGSSEKDSVTKNSAVTGNDMVGKVDSLTGDSTTKSNQIIMSDFPTFTFYRAQNNKPSLKFFRGIGGKSLRFYYHGPKSMSVNGINSDCNRGDGGCDDDTYEVLTDDRSIEFTGSTAIETPDRLYRKLVLEKDTVDKLLAEYPNFDKVTLKPFCFKPTSDQIKSLNSYEEDKSFFKPNTTYLGYQFTIGNTQFMLYPRPPGSPPPSIDDSPKNFKPKTKKTKDKQ